MTGSEREQAASRISQNLRCRLAESATVRNILSFIKAKIRRHIFNRTGGHPGFRCFSWINGQYAYGLLCSREEESIRALTAFYDKFLFLNYLGIPLFENAENYLHAEVLLALYRDYGKKRYLPLIKKAAASLKESALRNHGLIPYWQPGKMMLIDSLGMIGGFCRNYAEAFKDESLLNILNAQLAFVEENGIDADTSLPFHAINIESKEVEGISSWGRGIGWYLLGLSESAAGSPDYRSRCLEAVSTVLAYQDENGFFPNDIKTREHIDTSPTAMCALCLAGCLEYDLVPPERKPFFEEKLKLGISALLSSVSMAGEVLNCSGECMDAGQYSNQYGNYFAQGYTVSVLKKAEQLFPDVKE